MVIGERAIDFTKQRCDLTPQTGEQLHCHHAPHTIATIDGDFHGACQLNVVLNGIHIRWQHIRLRDPPFLCSRVQRFSNDAVI